MKTRLLRVEIFFMGQMFQNIHIIFQTTLNHCVTKMNKCEPTLKNLTFRHRPINKMLRCRLQTITQKLIIRLLSC